MPQKIDLRDDQLLVGLRRVVKGVPNTTYFAVPLVRKYLAGTIPLQDGDQVRVVSYKSTRLLPDKPQYPKPGPGEAPPQITVFAGTPSNSSVVLLTPGAKADEYQVIRAKFLSAVDQSDFSTLNSLTRINPNDGGVETFVIPNNSDKVAFPQFDSAMRSEMKVQDGDVYGLTTLPQVPAIALPAINAAKDSLLDVLRTSQAQVPTESRLRRSLNSLGRGQIPPVAPVTLPTLSTAPTLPRSLTIPPRGAIAARLQQHMDQKHQSRGSVDAAVVPAANSLSSAATTSVTR